jgi:hypothetical protein
MSAAEVIPHEQLVLAYRHLARPGWPQTLDAALAHHTYGTCLRGLARNLRRGAWRPDAAPGVHNPAASVPPTPATPPLQACRAKAGQRPSWDGKRAAANDLD